MTNRTNIRPYSAGVILNNVKKPRLRRFDLTFDVGPPPTPEGINNGVRPHGGYRGMRQLPPGQFSFNKDDEFKHELDVGYQILVNNENYETHGAPYWLSEVQREITHSGESPLFTHNLLPSGKYEPDPSVASLELRNNRANKRRPLVPRRRYLNGRREYYRPNSTHNYLSATDLRSLSENEENMIRYGRPTRTTLLRARQRTNSAPVNAYDLRRELNKKNEEAKNCIPPYNVSKEYISLCSTEGESMHSFLTGARYNRAHLLDSKGLTVYGVYMPRGHPGDCFITGPRRIKDGEQVPSAPPDSPRSDLDDSPTPVIFSRPASSKPNVSANAVPRLDSGRPPTQQAGSRPQSVKSSKSAKKPSSRVPSSRPRSAKDQSPSHAQQKTVLKSAEKKELPLPDEVTMAMPDHINKGKQGVYVTLKGQKMIESIDSKLPRVTGVSLPKLHKPRDFVDEMLYVNQPPPTPVDPSAQSIDKTKLETSTMDTKSTGPIPDKPQSAEITYLKPVEEVDKERNEAMETKGEEIRDVAGKITTDNDDKETNVVADKVVMQSESNVSSKKVNFEDMQMPKQEDEVAKDYKETEAKQMTESKGDNVVFFMTEGNEAQEKEVDNETIDKIKGNETTEQSPNVKYIANSVTRSNYNKTEDNNEANSGNNSNDETSGNEEVGRTVESVIKIEISETEKKKDDSSAVNETEEQNPVTSDSYPFNKDNREN